MSQRLGLAQCLRRSNFPPQDDNKIDGRENLRVAGETVVQQVDTAKPLQTTCQSRFSLCCVGISSAFFRDPKKAFDLVSF